MSPKNCEQIITILNGDLAGSYMIFATFREKTKSREESTYLETGELRFVEWWTKKYLGHGGCNLIWQLLQTIRDRLNAE